MGQKHKGGIFMLDVKLNAVKDYLGTSEYLRQIADDGHGRGILEFTESFIQSVASFGVSELYAREAERCIALKLSDTKADYSLERSKQYHEKGLRNIAYAKESLKQFKAELKEYPNDLKLEKNDIADFMKEFNEELSNLEIKKSDVEKISKTVKESMNFIAKKGANALPDYLEDKIDELGKIRSQADRGAVDNIPVWKIAAIAVAVGIWIWALFRCKWWGSCRLKEGLSYFILFWIAALIAKFC